MRGECSTLSGAGCPLFTPRHISGSAQCQAGPAAGDAASHVLYAQWMNGGRDPVEYDAHTGSAGLSLGTYVSGSSGSVAGPGVRCPGADRVCWSA